jgi:hypothetical protein
MSRLQLDMFGPPESVESSHRSTVRDDAPVPCERQLLWPADLTEMLGPELLEMLYGNVIRRTRLRTDEVCRELRVDQDHVRRLIAAGSLDATDIRHPDSITHQYRIYRYSLIRWLFNRDFVHNDFPRCNLPEADLQRCLNAAETITKRRRKAS